MSGFYVPEWDKAKTDVTTHHVEGLAREGMTPFSMPLISHVIGNLWQGGCIDGCQLPDDFDFVLSLYDRERYKTAPRTFYVQVEGMFDSAYMRESTELYKFARVARAFMRSGKVLVHCQAGLNRSGLISALALILDGYEPEEAIRLLRASRSPAVLCNKTFEQWLLDQPIGGAEQS